MDNVKVVGKKSKHLEEGKVYEVSAAEAELLIKKGVAVAEADSKKEKKA